MTAAIFGLLGVVVGGLLTGGVTYFMERRREKAELRQAKRLVGDELYTVALQAEGIDRWPTDVSERFFPTSSWEAHKPVLARGLRDDDWSDLAGVYAGIVAMRVVMSAQAGLVIDPEDKSLLAELRKLATGLHLRLTGTTPLSPSDAGQ